MSLVAGPGRGGTVQATSGTGLSPLVIERHVQYIQQLDTVRDIMSVRGVGQCIDLR